MSFYFMLFYDWWFRQFAIVYHPQQVLRWKWRSMRRFVCFFPFPRDDRGVALHTFRFYNVEKIKLKFSWMKTKARRSEREKGGGKLLWVYYNEHFFCKVFLQYKKKSWINNNKKNPQRKLMCFLAQPEPDLTVRFRRSRYVCGQCSDQSRKFWVMRLRFLSLNKLLSYMSFLRYFNTL